MKKLALLLASTVMAASQASAQAAQAPEEGTEDHVHQQADREIIITAPYVRALDILGSTAVLSGTDLVRELRPQIGDTLARLPGVSATSFSPGASRPVLRGFTGDRVRVMIDGIGSIDASNTSADHAVSIDPITTDRIEVLHGPAVLLFGSQAIGGAVNAFDRRIPRTIPDEPLHVDAIAAYGSAADERSIGAGVDAPLGSGFVVHLDGSYRKTDDLRVGGFVLSPRLRAEQLEIAEEEHGEGHIEEAEEALELANLRGRLPNSATEQKTLGAGVALIRDGGSLGFSVSYFGSDYGVPERPGGGHGEEEEEGEGEGEEHGGHGHAGPVTIGLEQLRADARAELNVGGGFIDKIKVRVAAADYEHTEFEGDEVGTIFRNNGLEGRFELAQADRGGWQGVIGSQFFTRDFSAVGEEAFVPPSRTSQIGLFTLQEMGFGPLELEGAARYERTTVEAPTIRERRRFNAYSLAAGASYEFAPRSRVGFNLSRAERVPTAEELYSNGPHIATQAFEIGNPDLRKERSLGAEAYVRFQGADYSFSASIYGNRFDNFIYLAGTDEEEDGLPIFTYLQRDATHYGFEMSGSATLFEAGGIRFVADGVADYVRATVEGEGPVPRIPPLRLLGGLEAQSRKLDGRVEVEKVFEQERVADFEEPTDGFVLVNASAAFRPWGRQNPTTFILSANNIFDVDARRHASFTREYVPLPGRDIRVSARISF